MLWLLLLHARNLSLETGGHQVGQARDLRTNSSPFMSRKPRSRQHRSVHRELDQTLIIATYEEAQTVAFQRYPFAITARSLS